MRREVDNNYGNNHGNNYGNNHGNNDNNGNSERQIQSMRQEIDTLKSYMSHVPNSVSMSQVSTGSAMHTMMGGRNEQANKRKRKNNNGNDSE